MDAILALAERNLLAGLLGKSPRLANTLSRQSLIAELVDNPDAFQFEGASAHDFAVLLIYHLAISGNRAALRRLVEHLLAVLPGSRKDLEYLQGKLAEFSEDESLAIASKEESQPEQAFIILQEIMAEPAVQRTAAQFQAVFQGACEQLDVVDDYKALHNLLHRLEFEVYNMIIGIAKRFPSDETSHDELENLHVELQRIVAELQEVASQPSFTRRQNLHLVWIQEVENAQHELQKSIEDSDIKRLKRVVHSMSRVLTRHPSTINNRLIESAAALRLHALVNAMILLCDRLGSLNLDAEKMGQFEHGVQALASLNLALSALLVEHNKWQEVDTDLRMLEERPPEDMEEFSASWGHVKAQTKPLYGEWAQQFETDAEKLEQSIANSAFPQVKGLFKKYCRRAHLRFFEVDRKLKLRCEEVRKVGDPLNAILGIML